MEGNINLQLDQKTRIAKAFSNYKKSPKERITITYVETRLENLEQLWQHFSSVHTQMLASPDQGKLHETGYMKEDVYDATSELYMEYKCELKSALSKLNAKPSDQSSTLTATSTVRSSQVKLPKITIPIFSGKYTEWTSFRDLFTSLVHKNKDIDDVQKLHYLKAHLTGEAEQLLRHMPITSESYSKCWTQLEGRYANKQYLSNCILKRFVSQKPLLTESATDIKNLLDCTTETLGALSSLGIDVGSWDVIIIYIVSQKLDHDSRKLWECKVSESLSLAEQLPTIEQFKDFLSTRYHSLEFLEPRPSYNNKPRYTSGNSNYKGTVSQVRGTQVQRVNNLHITNVSCTYCKGEHRIIHCEDFIGLEVDVKRNFVQTNGLCFNCLGINHSVRYCKNTRNCQICHRRHHSLLHQECELPSTDGTNTGDLAVHTQQVADLMDESTQSTSIATHFVSQITQQVLLATAVVEARSREREAQHLLRALIDQGSQASFITSAAVQLLGLKRTSVKGLISGLGGKQNIVSKSTVQVTIASRFDSECVLRVTAYVLDNLTTYLPAGRVSIASWPELQEINLADPEYHTPNKIDMLLGAEVYAQIIDTGVIKCPLQGAPVAQNTTLGWILSGQVGAHAQPNISCTLVSMHTQVDQLLRSFWELESEPSNNSKILSPEEQRCEEIYQATTTRDEFGRYIVRLPFRDEKPACVDGGSRAIALKRFHSLERRLQRDHHLKTEYTKVFHEYRELKHMEQLSARESRENGLYLPHHAVVRDDKDTTKVRIVFDASCKGVNGVSLNDDLLVGPTLQSDLRHIIMRWRMHPVCFIADIVKMYRQVKVDDRDMKYQRVLWRDNPNEEIQEYKLNRVTFGTSSAPYLAVKSLMQVAVDEGKDFPLAAPRVRQDFYMDDLMSGCQSESEAIEVYHQMKALLSKGGFDLQKWSSNSQVMLEGIKESNTGKDEYKKIEMKQEAVNKILGLTWDRSRDEFTYAVQLPPTSEPVTKRKVTSDIAKLYDPLGWIAPSIVQAKILIQRLWLAGIEWDEELPAPLLEEWLNYREELSQLTEFRLPRWTNHRKNATLVELHGFSDASNAAYAAVVYLRVTNVEGNIHVSLVTAKTKVAPIKQVSVPRLELCGAVLLAKLLGEVSGVLDVQKSNIHAWTDSEVVLAWLSSHPSRWKTFIGNRCSEILSVMNRSQWSHVKSEHNPADCASRGVAASELNNFDLWLNGPTWLNETIIHYPRPKSLVTQLEERNIHTHLGTSIVRMVGESEPMWSKYSSLTKLLRVVAYCRRFLKNKRKNHTYLLKTELDEALAIMVKRSQEEAYGEEINDIKNAKLKRKSKLTSFTPQIDEVGIVRVGGRLQFANMDYDQKHPILLPKSGWLTQLIVRDAHCKTLHGGVPLMVNYIRAKFCIPGLKGLTKAYVKRCIPCVRQAANIRNQLMGQLPAPRVNETKVFLRSGVDYAGPINLRVSKGRGNRSYKGYICLFICMATRAVHIELVSDLSTAGFLAAFKRFTSKRGYCSDLYSDNGTNFVGASGELRYLFDAERSNLVSEIADALAIGRTQWHFIPPHAPNFGGLWEAGIKSCKFHLKRVIGTSTLTYEEMATVLSQVEACLNSRPMWRIDENSEPLPLTPGHFLVGEPLIVASDRCYEHVPISPLRRWQLCQRMLQDFWRRWSQEYLTQFLQRPKWTERTPEPKVGDLVLVKEPDLPPARWLMGKVVETHPGLDNVTRVVTLKCKNSLIKRPTSRICVLPIAE